MDEQQTAEAAYRRGFDQGLYAALTAVGYEDKTIQKLDYKVRIGNWRYGRKQFSLKKRQNAPQPTKAELGQIRVWVLANYTLQLNQSPDEGNYN